MDTSGGRDGSYGYRKDHQSHLRGNPLVNPEQDFQPHIKLYYPDSQGGGHPEDSSQDGGSVNGVPQRAVEFVSKNRVEGGAYR